MCIYIYVSVSVYIYIYIYIKLNSSDVIHYIFISTICWHRSLLQMANHFQWTLTVSLGKES